MRGTSLTKFAKGDPHAKDQPRHPAGESALDPAVRIAQQGAGIQRVKSKQRKPMTSAFHDPEIRILFPFRDFKVGDWVQLIDRLTVIEGEILHVYSDSDLLLIERSGQYKIVNRRYVYKNDLAPLVDQPQPRKALDDLVYDRPALPNGKIGGLMVDQPALLMLPALCPNGRDFIGCKDYEGKGK